MGKRITAAAAVCLLVSAFLSCSTPQSTRRGEDAVITAPPPAGKGDRIDRGGGAGAPSREPLPLPPALIKAPSEGVVPTLSLPPEGGGKVAAARVSPAIPADGGPLPSAVEEPVDAHATIAIETPVKATPPDDDVADPDSVSAPAKESPHVAGSRSNVATSGPGTTPAGAPPRKEDRKKPAKDVPRAVAPVPPVPPVPPRYWQWEGEDLSFQIRYLGVPCGYARFSAKGRVKLGEKEAIHLQVRGWTSKLLSIVYPLDTTMDYYLDPKSLLPLRIDQTKTERGKYSSSIAVYDQDNGVITYWRKDSGRMEKRVRVVPFVHDPVSVVYNIRTIDPAVAQSPRFVYAGRKIWQVQPRQVGFERIPDENGKEIDTVVLAPLIRREGQVESKGDIRVWISRDGRHAPVRIYASIKLGTVEGRLISPRSGG